MNQLEILTVERLHKQFSQTKQSVLQDINFSLLEGELLGLLGPSGCGKTTLLRIIAGFEQPTSGTIKLQKQIVANPQHNIPPEQRLTGMVFQDYALFPHLTVGENIAFGLKTKSSNWSREGIRQRIKEVLEVVSLSGLEKRYPHALSGGQQQRVALARALAPKPALILLDEPLSNLDVQVREKLRHEVRNILKATGISGIFVTHDQEEALAVSDKIAVMCNGRIEQIGTPESIYTQPLTRFVAEFVTQANFLPANRQKDCWATEIGDWTISKNHIFTQEKEVELMFRQEDIQMQPAENSATVIVDRHFLGREYRYCLETPSGKRLHALTNLSTNLSIGTKVKISIPEQCLRIFS